MGDDGDDAADEGSDAAGVVVGDGFEDGTRLTGGLRG